MFSLLFMACSIYNITPIETFSAPRAIQVTEYSELASFGEVNIELFNKPNIYIPASVRILDGEKTIYIDPLYVNPLKKADFILLTHSHADHFSKKDIENVVTEGTIIIAPKSMIGKLEEYQTQAVEPNEAYEVNGLQFETLPAYNTKRTGLGIKVHPPRKGYVGYVLNIDDKKIYHPGDTDVLPELMALKDIDVAMIPIDAEDGVFTLNIEEATQLINHMKPKMVIPIHYEVEQGYVEEFRKGIDVGIGVLVFTEE